MEKLHNRQSHLADADPHSLAKVLALCRAELAVSESRNRVLFTDSPLALIVYDPLSWQVLAVNAACVDLFGYPETKWLAQPLPFAEAGEQGAALRSVAQGLAADPGRLTPPLRLRLAHRDAYVLEADARVRNYDFNGRAAQILILQDSSERRQAEEYLRLMATQHRQQLELSAHYDSLTGLPNRSLFAERARQGLFQCQLSASSMAVCYLDLDSFAALNATHGQTVCDHLLINTAECLRSSLRGGDTLIRVGSDEFALLVLGIKSEEEVLLILQDLQQRLAEPFISDSACVTVSVSIGVTIYPQDNADPETLLRHALQAMIQAKHRGSGDSVVFDPESDRRVRAKRESVDSVYAALARREFVLHYQPKVDLKLKRVVGAEALIRWRHPERGLLLPGAFLPAIEDDRVMIALGNWVIGEALAQMQRWHEQGLDLSLSVNITAQHLLAPDFLSGLRQLLLACSGPTTSRLEIEVLESSHIEDAAKVEQIIVACRELGVGFALDDFGTGYSSLAYLRRLSADTLKIDQSFVSRMLDDPSDLAIVSGVIGLAAAFQRRLVAEGVETIAQARRLLRLGCHLVQGYGIARPMPAEAIPAWVASWPDAAWLAIDEDDEPTGRC
ncbi:putative bifunctional diguanylate cyclase/phosphodiesterase [Rhodocyclus tenuis]|uniref:putative bifunctional diguanylate cyclase/phosphodiesterase n=1 Tax=Rhodocyclus tenuis TaxID=1066 RepID=UPI0019050F90|nr:GGDEF domain-containing phosphodiesterase [Rhodocyclus tenuis]MBK1680494.1 hypothetical protein [Rhodocyclus tenuis]